MAEGQADQDHGERLQCRRHRPADRDLRHGGEEQAAAERDGRLAGERRAEQRVERLGARGESEICHRKFPFLRDMVLPLSQTGHGLSIRPSERLTILSRAAAWASVDPPGRNGYIRRHDDTPLRTQVFLAHHVPEGHPERPDRLRALNAALEHPHFSTLDRKEAPVANEDAVLLAHPVEHLFSVMRSMPEEGVKQIEADTHASPKA